MDIRQSNNWGEYLKALNWKSHSFKHKEVVINIRIRKFLFLFSIIKVQRPRVIDSDILRRIDALGRKERALFIKIDLAEKIDEAVVKKAGYKKDGWPTLCTKTVLVRTERCEKGFSKDARYQIRKAEAENVKVKFFGLTDPKGQEIFYSLYKQSAKRSNFYAPSLKKNLKYKFKAFKKDGFICVAFKKSAPMAVAVILIHKNIGYYAHVGTCDEGRKNGSSYAVVLHTLKELKKRSVDFLDFEGVYDERYPKLTKQWKKYSIFKRKFGGEIIEHPGSFTKYFPYLLKKPAKQIPHV